MGKGRGRGLVSVGGTTRLPFCTAWRECSRGRSFAVLVLKERRRVAESSRKGRGWSTRSWSPGLGGPRLIFCAPLFAVKGANNVVSHSLRQQGFLLSQPGLRGPRGPLPLGENRDNRR